MRFGSRHLDRILAIMLTWSLSVRVLDDNLSQACSWAKSRCASDRYSAHEVNVDVESRTDWLDTDSEMRHAICMSVSSLRQISSFGGNPELHLTLPRFFLGFRACTEQNFVLLLLVEEEKLPRVGCCMTLKPYTCQHCQKANAII